eukprot:Sspe_Gene.6707::Locus_2258_Transcript_1_1_Confidence_1.000_Length_12062::g.6707::m.6707
MEHREGGVDFAQERCSICARSFTFFVRRHWCRECLRTICSNCSAMPLNFLSRKHPNNICKMCVEERQHAERQRRGGKKKAGVSVAVPAGGGHHGEPVSPTRPPTSPLARQASMQYLLARRCSSLRSKPISFERNGSGVNTTVSPGVSGTARLSPGHPTVVPATLPRVGTLEQSANFPRSLSFYGGRQPMGSLRQMSLASFAFPAERVDETVGGITVPMSYSQRFIADALPASTCLVWKAAATERIDVGRLRACLHLLVERHSILRVSFDLEARTQTIHNHVLVDVALRSTSWSSVAKESYAAFDTSEPSLFRCRVHRGKERDSVTMSFHPLVMDYSSLTIFLDDLRILYQNITTTAIQKQNQREQIMHDDVPHSLPAGMFGSIPQSPIHKASSLPRSFGSDMEHLVEQRPLLPPMELQWSTYVQYECSRTEESFSTSDAYWLSQLSIDEECALHTSLPSKRHSERRGVKCTSVAAPIPRGVLDKAFDFGKKHGIPFRIILQAAWMLLLSRYSSEERIVIGVQTPQRSVKGVEDMVGPFSNISPSQAFMTEGISFGALCEQVRVSEGRDSVHSSYPFSLLLKKLFPAKANPTETGLARVGYVYEGKGNTLSTMPFVLGLSGSEVNLGAMSLLPIANGTGTEHVASMFDLSLFTYLKRGSPTAALVASSAFAPEIIQNMAANLVHLLGCSVTMASDTPIQQLSVVASGQAAALIYDLNGIARNTTNFVHPRADEVHHPMFTSLSCKETSKAYGKLSKERQALRRGAHRVLEDNARKIPDVPIATFEGTSISYRELNERANRLARQLLENRGRMVGIYLSRSIELLVAIAGVWKAGAGYLPLDPTYPADRLKYMMENAEVTNVVTSSELRKGSDLFDGTAIQTLDIDTLDLTRGDGSDLDIDIDGESIAYVIYTSGSTGKPKGTLVCHRVVINLVAWSDEARPGRPGMKVLQFTPYSFDVSVQEMWSTISQGGTLCMLRNEVRLDPKQLIPFIIQHKVERVFLPPVALCLMADTALEFHKYPTTITDMYACGEALVITPAVANMFSVVGGDTCKAALHNDYGPSECNTVMFYELRGAPEKWERLPPIGRPICNTYCLVLDNNLQLVPVGAEGELYYGGDCVGKGYWKLPEITARCFLNNPYLPGTLMYKSGDIVKMRTDGHIDFIRRKDFQIKLRGFRIELGEIESTLSQCSKVRSCAVVLRNDNGEKRLVAYYIGDADVDELTKYLKAKVPSYMVPSIFVKCDTFPKTASGKVNRKALPDPSTVLPVLPAETHAAPRTDTEKRIAELWKKVLGSLPPTLHTSFFEVGGHSLTAVRFLNAITSAFGVEVPLNEAFAKPTIADLAAKVDALERKEVPPLGVGVANPSILSYPQQALWFMDINNPSCAAQYNIPFQGVVRGGFSEKKLKKAMGELLVTHPMLHTTYHADDEGLPYQAVADPVVDYKVITADVAYSEGTAVLQKEAFRRFDLEKDMMMRARLFRFKDGVEVLQFVFHHICTDLWSIDVLLTDFRRFYAGKPPVVEAPQPYYHYSQWLHDKVEREETALAKWKQLLPDLPVLRIAEDKPKPSVQTHHGGSHTLRLSKKALEDLRAAARACSSTVYNFLLSLYFLFLNAYTDQKSIVIGTPAACRTEEYEHTVGYFINAVPIFKTINHTLPLIDFVADVRSTVLDAMSMQHYPFQLLVNHFVGVERSSGHTPIFQTMFVFQTPPSLTEISPFFVNAAGESIDLGGLALESIDVPNPYAQFDIIMQAAEVSDGLALEIIYNTDCFLASTTKRLLRCFGAFIESIAASSSFTEPILSYAVAPKHEVELFRKWNATEEPYPELHDEKWSMVSHLAKLAAEAPERVAVDDSAGSGLVLSFKDLDNESTRMARVLVAKVGTGKRVGIMMKKCAKMVVAMFAVLKTRGAYVPLDPSAPVDRVGYMCSDSQISCILTHAPTCDFSTTVTKLSVDEDFDEQCDAELPSITARDLAYVIYTSGSTGKPKGVLLEHYGIANLVNGVCKRDYKLDSTTRMLQFASICFDASIVEIFGVILSGGACVFAGVESRDLPGDPLVEVIRKLNITQALIPPSVLALLDPSIPYGKLTTIMSAGEAISAPVAAAWAKHMRYLNCYGPTENTVAVTCCDVRGAGFNITQKITCETTVMRAPIGKPHANNKLYIVDGSLRLLPLGAVGELAISSVSLSRGYINNPRKTAECFVPNPFRGIDGDESPRMYRTGDMCRWIADTGHLDYIGRADFQVKVRGFRIELGEIDCAFLEHPAVQSCCTVVREDHKEQKQIVSYVVFRGKSIPSMGEMRSFLKQWLPDYMLPNVIIRLEHLPLNTSGKVDKSALPPPFNSKDALLGGDAELVVAPSNATQAHLVELVKQILNLTSVSVTSSFFDIGGHSLAATQLALRIRRAFQVDLPVSKVFEFPTIVALAEVVDGYVSVTAGAEEGEGDLSPYCDSLSTSPVSTRASPQPSDEDVCDLFDESAPKTYRLSYGQEALWFMQALEPESSAFNVIFAARTRKGHLKASTLEKAVRGLVLIHPVLRVTFSEENAKPYQTFNTRNIEVDFQCMTTDTPEQDLVRDMHHPFDLTVGTPFMVRQYNDTHFLLLFHHILVDLWSVEIIVDHLVQLYAFLEKESPVLDYSTVSSASFLMNVVKTKPPSSSFGTFVDWQRRRLEGVMAESLLGYWVRMLAGCNTTLNLPTDFPRPAKLTYVGHTASVSISPAVREAVLAYSSRTQTTTFATILSCLYCLLFRYTGQQDILIGTPVSCRNDLSLESLVGDFLNVMLVRGQIASTGSDPFCALSESIKAQLISSLEYRDVPFQWLVERLQNHRDTSRSPLFQVMFVHERPHHTRCHLSPFLMGHDGGRMDFGSAVMESFEMAQQIAQYDFTFCFVETTDAMKLTVQYNTDLYKRSTAENMLNHFLSIIENAVTVSNTPINELQLCNKASKVPDAVPYPDVVNRCLVTEPVLRAAAQHPNHVMIEDPTSGKSATYKEAVMRAQTLAKRLWKIGVGRGGVVAIILPRSYEYALSILSIAVAGAVYLPMDPTWPPERLAFIIEDCEAKAVISTPRIVSNLTLPEVPFIDATTVFTEAPPTGHVAVPKEATVKDPLYMIYTSGSTGKPKGVKVHHQGVVNICSWFNDFYKVSKEDRSGQILGAAFDPVTIELWPFWMVGATVVIVSEEAKKSGIGPLCNFTAKHGITFLNLPTVLTDMLLRETLPPMKLRVVVTGGDKLRGANKKVPFAICNNYGPTEGTVMCTTYPLNCPEGGLPAQPPTEPLTPPEGRILVNPPIGKACSNYALYIMDDTKHPVPDGVPGELYIGGLGVALGYHNRPANNDAAFFVDEKRPFAKLNALPPRMYRTGDKVRMLEDGNIEFIGRVDFQVKLRGFRIELGEIESCIMSSGVVKETCVIVREDQMGEKRLVGYIQPSAPDSPSLDAVKAHLRDHLPSYMIPDSLVSLDSFPLTANGKVDRANLPPPPHESDDQPAAEAMTPEERKMSELWGEVLGRKVVPVTANFFEIGGSSLSSMLLLSRIREVYNRDVTLSQFFAAPTVRQLAVLLATPSSKAHAVAADQRKQLQGDGIGMFPKNLVPAKGCGEGDGAVLLTGSTGFMGAAILHDLVASFPGRVVYCHVRARTASEGAARIQANLRRYGLGLEDSSNVIPVLGDLGQIRLGIETETWENDLAGEVSLIIHSGAMVNFTYPYAALRSTNVGSVVQLLQLASLKRAKKLVYISTLSAFESCRNVKEDFTRHMPEPLEGGYPQSKWVAERVLTCAHDAGFNVTIFRAGRITGFSDTGVANTDDFFHRWLIGCALMRKAPRLNMKVEMTPLDFAARTITALSANPVSNGKVYHLCNPNFTDWETLLSVGSRSFPMEMVSYQNWRKLLLADPPDMLASLVALFEPDLEGYEAAQSRAPNFRCDLIFDDLKKVGKPLSCPPSESLAPVYWRYLASLVIPRTASHPNAPLPSL